MKRKINIILLLTVLILWGTVIYKYVSQYFSKNEIIAAKNESYQRGANKAIAKDSFQLAKIIRDPFLNITYGGDEKKYLEKSMNRIVKKSAINDKPKRVVITNFPRVQYYGYIKSKDIAKELLLVSVDGKLLKLKINEDKDGFKIIQFTDDSINTYFNKVTKWVKIHKK
jgi:hypothetical protein